MYTVASNKNTRFVEVRFRGVPHHRHLRLFQQKNQERLRDGNLKRYIQSIGSCFRYDKQHSTKFEGILWAYETEDFLPQLDTELTTIPKIQITQTEITRKS